MKSILFASLFLLFFLTGFAQDTIPRTKGYFGIAIGAGFPLKSFVAKDFTNDKSGFANTGSNLQINYSRTFAKNVSGLIRGNINTNPFDVYELANSYNTKDTFNGINYSVNSKNWYCIGGMLGLNYSIPINDFAIELYALVGYQYAESPQQKVTLHDGNDSTTITFSTGTSSGIMWTTGATVSYQLSSRTSVALGVEYYSFNGTFRNSKILIDEKPLANRNDFDMDIYILNCIAGVRYHF